MLISNSFSLYLNDRVICFILLVSDIIYSFMIGDSLIKSIPEGFIVGLVFTFLKRNNEILFIYIFSYSLFSQFTNN